MSPFYTRNLHLRTILYYGMLLILGCLLIGYTLFQARFLIAGPQITLISEPEGIHSQRFVVLEGTAENIVRMTLNGRQIYTDKNGYFKEGLILENGYTIATLQAYDRYGRTHSYKKEFVYTPASLLN